jgi:hypothetical protein
VTGGVDGVVWPQDESVSICGECGTSDGESDEGWLCRTNGRFDSEKFVAAYLSSERWASACMMDFWIDYPKHCLELVKIGASICSSDEQQCRLGAGALESLLGTHGDSLISDVERQARRDPSFREVLGYVWQHGMSEATWRRVLSASGRVEATLK